jgi:hypothetical protein
MEVQNQHPLLSGHNKKLKRILNEYNGGQWRTGKWQKEELLYTDLIKRGFQMGFLPASWKVQKGASLRQILSARLMCVPMRITKKYQAREALGKQVYHPCDHSSSNINRAELISRIEEAEKQFVSRALEYYSARETRKPRASCRTRGNIDDEMDPSGADEKLAVVELLALATSSSDCALPSEEVQEIKRGALKSEKRAFPPMPSVKRRRVDEPHENDAKVSNDDYDDGGQG